MFEEFAVVQTRAIFFFVIETELKMMKCFIENDERTPWDSKITDTLIRMQENLRQYSTVIEDVKKGYVLHKKTNYPRFGANGFVFLEDKQ